MNLIGAVNLISARRKAALQLLFLCFFVKREDSLDDCFLALLLAHIALDGPQPHLEVVLILLPRVQLLLHERVRGLLLRVEGLLHGDVLVEAVDAHTVRVDRRGRRLDGLDGRRDGLREVDVVQQFFRGLDALARLVAGRVIGPRPAGFLLLVQVHRERVDEVRCDRAGAVPQYQRVLDFFGQRGAQLIDILFGLLQVPESGLVEPQGLVELGVGSRHRVWGLRS